MRVSRLYGIAVGLVGLSGSMTARGEDAAGAKAMFDRAVEARKAGNLQEACPAFGESHRLSPQPGTLFEWASCEEQTGNIASAAVHYYQFLMNVRALDPVQRAKFKPRIAKAEAARVALDPEIPRLTIVLPKGAPPGTTFTRDGIELKDVTSGVEIPVDPGEHIVMTRGPKGQVYEQKVVLVRKDRIRVEAKLPNEPLPGPVVEPGPTLEKTRLPPIESPKEPANGRRIAGAIGIGLGVLGLGGAGAAFGLAISKKSFADQTCPNLVCANESDKTLASNAWKSAKTMADVSTVSLGIGIAAAAFGGVMLVASGSRKEHALPKQSVHLDILHVNKTEAFLGLKGEF